MGIDAHPELADLLLGRGAAERRGAPEPTLLPHLAPIARGEAPGWICESVDLYASGRSGLPPWPDLRNAVFARVAPGLGRDEDARGLLRRFPGRPTARSCWCGWRRDFRSTATGRCGMPPAMRS